MSSLKSTTLFVNHKLAPIKVSGNYKTIAVIDTMRVKFGTEKKFATDLINCDGKNIFKELTEIGSGSRSAQGKAIRKRIASVLADGYQDITDYKYGIYNHGSTVKITLITLSRSYTKYTGMLILLDCDFSNTRAKITVHQEYIDREFYATTGNMTMTHKLETDRNEKRGGTTRKVKAVITATSTNAEVKQAIQENNEVTNHNADITEELIARMARLERMMEMQTKLVRMINNEKYEIATTELDMFSEGDFVTGEQDSELESLLGSLV